MNSRVRPSFWRAYERLSEINRMAARRAYAIFTKNSDHPSLPFKKLGGYDDVWSVRINEQYRAIGERKAIPLFGFGLAHTMNSITALVRFFSHENFYPNFP